MRVLRNFVFISVLLLLAQGASAKETLEFPSKDGVIITADAYLINEDKQTPFIVLFHQAEWSRGEYLEIAPQLNKMGYNCMAVDLRSGEAVNKVVNKTASRAKAKGKGTTHADALPDVKAALAYVRKNFASDRLIAWGSSYSASLVIKVAGDDPQLVDGVLSFAPGEYFKDFGKPSDWIAKSAAKITKLPVFITSAKNEKSYWSAIFNAIPSQNKTAYLPETSGNHGSRALWKKFSDSKGYWQAVKQFLKTFFPSESV